MVHKIHRTIARYHLLQRGGSVVAGVSGGADSVALLDFLCSIREEWRFRLAVCHVNHRLRGEESDQDEAFVRELCGTRNVKLFCFTEEITQIAQQKGQSIEWTARDIRYARFQETAQALGEGTRIATAHTLSDSMETALFHFARGTGPTGLCGIPPVRENIVRPLIEVTRREVEAYCEERGLSYRTDSTNLCDDYTRNRIRHRIVPELYEINPQADAAFLRLSDILCQERDYLAQQARTLIKESGWSVSVLQQAHPALLRQALVLLLKDNGLPVRFECIDRLAASVMDEGPVRWEIERGCFFCIDQGVVRIEALIVEPVPEPQETPICDGISVQIGDTIASFFYADYGHYKETENSEKSYLKNVVDYDKIKYHAVVRTRRAGDQFSLPGRNWTKTLKKLMNEAGIPREQRDRLFVCADSEGVFWVEGFGVDRRAAPDDATKRVLLIRMSKVGDATK